MLRPKRRPAARGGGFLRSDRRADPGEGEAASRDGREGSGSPGDGSDGGAPEVRIRRSARGGSLPVAKVTTLALLLLLVLAIIFLL